MTRRDKVATGLKACLGNDTMCVDGNCPYHGLGDECTEELLRDTTGELNEAASNGDETFVKAIREALKCGDQHIMLDSYDNQISLHIFPQSDDTIVSIRPLSEWLAGLSEPPGYALDEISNGGYASEACRMAKAWEKAIKDALDCGLLDEEDS